MWISNVRVLDLHGSDLDRACPKSEPHRGSNGPFDVISWKPVDHLPDLSQCPFEWSPTVFPLIIASWRVWMKEELSFVHHLRFLVLDGLGSFTNLFLFFDVTIFGSESTLPKTHGINCKLPAEPFCDTSVLLESHIQHPCKKDEEVQTLWIHMNHNM